MGKSGKQASGHNSIRRKAENIIMACLALIVVISGWKIYTIMSEYGRNQGIYDGISETAQTEGFTGDIDFEALRRINPDVVGWIFYEDTVIDYPVVQGEDNKKYLYTIFDGTTGGFGTLFADAATEKPFAQFNTIVYGHHMRNGSMFAPLRKLKDEAYCREHPQLELITPEGKFHLAIWAFLNEPADSDIYIANITDRDERAGYISMAGRLSEYTTDVSVSPDDRLVVLSTCAYEYKNARYMVIAKMIPWDGQNIDMSYDSDTGTDSYE